MPSKFKYRPRSIESVQERAKQTGGGYDSYVISTAEFVKVKESENNFRILPPTWDLKDKRWGDNWGLQIWLHRDIGPDKGVYLCLDKMKGEPCPLCEARLDVADEEAQRALKPQLNILAYIIDRDNERAGPLLWRMGWQTERDFQQRSIDKRTGGVIPLDDPDEGYDISFIRTGQGLKTRYSAFDIARDPSPLSEKAARRDAWIDYIVDNPIPAILQYYDAEHLQAVYSGKRAPSDEDEGDARPIRSAKRSAAVEEDEEETPRKPSRRTAVEEEEEEVRPARRSARNGRADEEEEDDIPDRIKNGPERGTRARTAAVEDEEEDDLPVSTARAKASLERLKPKASRRTADEDDD